MTCCMYHFVTGNKLELLCDQVSITLNKNSINGDTSAFAPGGVRIGSPALTARGFREDEFKYVAELLHRAVQLTIELQQQYGKKLDDFKKGLANDNDKIKQLKADVEAFATKYYMPGFQHILDLQKSSH